MNILPITHMFSSERTSQHHLSQIIHPKSCGLTENEMVRWHQLWEIVRDREAWRVAVHGVAKTRAQLSNLNTTNKFYGLSEQSSVLENWLYPRERCTFAASSKASAETRLLPAQVNWEIKALFFLMITFKRDT